MRCASTTATGTWSATISTATPRARSRSPESEATSASRHVGSAISATPQDFNVEEHRVPRPWQIGEIVGRARIAVSEDTAWWVERTLSDAGVVDDGVFETDYANVELLAGWVLRQNGRAIPLEPDELVESVTEALATLAAAHDGDAPAVAGPKRSDPRQPLPERPTGPVAPERFGVLQALLAHLLAACGDERSATISADEITTRFSIPLEELQDHLSLLNLVNFGGGCYAVYAEHDGDVVRVEKELYGDVFRKSPKLTPLEARAIRLAIEYVGPTIAADAHTPLKRVRKKLEETFGRFDLAGTPQPSDASAEESLVKVLSDGAEKRLVVEIEYLKDGDDSPSMRQVEPYTIERELPVWRVHTWDLSVDAARTFRLDRMRSARLTGASFDARDGFDPVLHAQSARRPAAALACGGTLEARARRPSAHRRLGRGRRAVQDGGVAPLRGTRRSRRDDRPRAATPARRRRKARAPAPARTRTRPQQTLIFT